MPTSPSIVWLRHDLRLADNPALRAAHDRGEPVIPVFIWAPDEEKPWAPGGASRWWLHQSLEALQGSLKEAGSRLIIREGSSQATLQALVGETKAGAVYWNRRYEPAVIDRDQDIKRELRSETLEVKSFNAALLHEPWEVEKKSGGPFQVFTPFWKTCLSMDDPDEPVAKPQSLETPGSWPKSIPLKELGLEPEIDWAGGMRKAWTPGEAGAREQVRRFLKEAVLDYSEDRNRPDLRGTSRLSPHLHFGEIGPRQVWHEIRKYGDRNKIPAKKWKSWQYLAEVGWREFSHHLIYHFPHTTDEPLREKFKKFPWRKNRKQLKAWQKGMTGFPIVDAGMRELWETGWMHNRVRMIVASFLVKDLLITWKEGARWFWDTLVDADLAQNTLGWQWTSGCGADAAPYFRVFNPMGQGEKFDPQGEYVRRWVPELAGLPDKWLNRPWEAPEGVLEKAEVELGETYPEPIVNHSVAREVALEAFEKLKG